MIICWDIGPDSSWGSTTAEICDKIVDFFRHFTSITFHTGTKDLSLAQWALGCIKSRRLVSFQCLSCGWLLFSINIGISNQRPGEIWRRPPRNIAKLIQSLTFAATLRNSPSMSHLISHVGGNKVLMWWMDVHVPKLSPCWYYWPPSTAKVTLQKWQHEVVWPNHRTKWQENAIGSQSGSIMSEWKPRYRRFGVYRHTYWESGIAVEKLRRIWMFWFYLSLCENTMGYKHKLNNQHIQFRSLVHT